MDFLGPSTIHQAGSVREEQETQHQEQQQEDENENLSRRFCGRLSFI